MQGELATSIEQGQMSDEARASLWEYIDETKGEIGVDFAKDAAVTGVEQMGLALLRKSLKNTIDKVGVKGPKGENSFVMFDEEAVNKVEETKSKNVELTKYGKWAGKRLTAVGLYSGYQGNIDEGKTVGEAVSHTGTSFIVGAGVAKLGGMAVTLAVGATPVGWAAVGAAAIAIGVGTLGSFAFDYAYDTNFLGTKYAVDKVGQGLDWTGNKIKDGVNWTKNKAGEAVQGVKDKAGEPVEEVKDEVIQGTKNIIKGVGEAFKGGPGWIKPKMNWGGN